MCKLISMLIPLAILMAIALLGVGLEEGYVRVR